MPRPSTKRYVTLTLSVTEQQAGVLLVALVHARNHSADLRITDAERTALTHAVEVYSEAWQETVER